jgi:NAD(P)-dependent dehydrogenase (short-subunit alcohol dehydrogenase family)
MTEPDEQATDERGGGRLTGRVAIVTGAGQGIGKGIARAFAREGADVVLVSRTPENLNATADEIEALGGRVRRLAGDVAQRATADRAVEDAVSSFGRLDVVVNDAHSFTKSVTLEEMPEENFRINLETGLFGTIHFMQAAFPHLRERGGSIINFGSYNGVYGMAGYAAYAATKEGIRGVTRCAARDWGQYRIRVNVINPAAMTEAARRHLARSPENLKLITDTIAMGYIGDIDEDIAPVAVFLASDDSRYMTGQTINAEGGRWMS